MTMAELRVGATEKFGEAASRMYFTKDGLEQSTRAEVAAHRAARVALAGPSSVLDLGCGIGGDLVALARRGVTAAGVDQRGRRALMVVGDIRDLSESLAEQTVRHFGRLDIWVNNVGGSAVVEYDPI